MYFGQEFVTGRKLKLNREAAAWEVQRAKRELSAMRLRVLSDTRIAFYEVLIAQRRKELAGKLVKISDKGVEAAIRVCDYTRSRLVEDKSDAQD